MSAVRKTAVRRVVRRTRDDEFHIQAAFFALVDLDARTKALPIYAVPNFAGHYGTAVSRIVAGKRANMAGRKKGVPDVCIDVPRGTHHGFRIEFKTDVGRVSPEQRTWIAMLEAQGFRVDVHRSARHAWDALLVYLSLPSAP